MSTNETSVQPCIRKGLQKGPQKRPLVADNDDTNNPEPRVRKFPFAAAERDVRLARTLAAFAEAPSVHTMLAQDRVNYPDADTVNTDSEVSDDSDSDFDSDSGTDSDLKSVVAMSALRWAPSARMFPLDQLGRSAETAIYVSDRDTDSDVDDDDQYLGDSESDE